MNTSQFMDKQIMDLSNSQSKSNGNNDLMDLNAPPHQDDHEVGGGGAKKDEILPSYDFQPIRPLASSQSSNFDSSNVGEARVWVSAESKTNSGIRNYGSLDSVEPAKVVVKGPAVLDAALILEIDKTMKKHVDNLMHTLEGVSARLSQLESRSRHLENSVDDLRTFVGNNHANSDRKLRQIENMVREVQAGVLVVKDKQELLESQLHLSQLQISKPDPQPEPQMAHRMESLQHQAVPPPTAAVAPPLPATLSNAPPPPPTSHTLAPSLHHPNQFPQRESYYSPPGQPTEPPPHHHQLPPPQTAAPPPQYQPPPHIQYSQPPSHQFQGNPSQMYEPPSSRTGSEFPRPYGLDQPYPYGGSPIKLQQHSSPNMGPSGSGGYPQLPNARVLPHVLPTSSSSSSGSGNRVPIDDVVDKVTNMGFPRDQVRATVRKLTENGQAVDLNVVLDKLMTDGVESQGPRAWFSH